MQQINLKPSYDVIVIGAGMGGLTAAALLSKTGFSVCVLEMADHAGGYLAGFRRKDFRFDTAIHWLNQCGPGGMASKIFDVLGTDYPRTKPQTRIRRYKGDTFDYLLTNNPDEWKNQLIAEFPHEKIGLENFFKAAKRLGKSFNNFGSIFRAEENMTFLERAKNKMRLLKFAMPFIPYLTYTGDTGIKRGLNKFFKDEKLHRIFSSETDLLSCLVPIGWAYYRDFQNPPQGGSQTFPEWLEYITQYFHNELYYKCRVQEILLEGNKCSGVKFECRGKVYEAKSRYVIAACDVETLYEKMLPEKLLSKKFKAKLRHAELYSSSVTVSIALDCPTEQLGFNEELIHLSREDVSRDAHSSGNPDSSGISILAPSLRDKTMSPEGKGTLTLYIPACWDYNNFWKAEKDEHGNLIRGEAYQKHKIEIAEILIKRVEEKIAPGLRSHILFYEVATPITHFRYTGNKFGSLMGARPSKLNMQAKIAHYQTPVQNLILGGHWAELGGGVPIAVKAGANATLVVLKKENKNAFALMAEYMDGKRTLKEILNSTAFKAYDNSWKRQSTPAEKLTVRVKHVDFKN